jgi:dipeptidyl aminopeptidase/acylaminoacyl peptidase
VTSRVLVVITFTIAISACVTALARSFTVEDDIGFASFSGIGKDGSAILMAPDRKTFAVVVEAGDLRANRIRTTLRCYRLNELKPLTDVEPGAGRPFQLEFTDARFGPQVSDLAWTADSRNLAFIRRDASGQRHLSLLDVPTGRVTSISDPSTDVVAFAIRDRNHFAYAAAVSSVRHFEEDQVFVVGTGKGLGELTLGLIDSTAMSGWENRSELWFADSGVARRVRAHGGNDPFTLFWIGQKALTLSPDGSTVVTIVPVPDIPQNWVVNYPPPFSTAPFRVRPGPQTLDVNEGTRLVGQYVKIDPRAGLATALTDAPESVLAGWWGEGTPSWSSNGRKIILPHTFVDDGRSGLHRPCVAVVDIVTGSRSCLLTMGALREAGPDKEFFTLLKASFTKARTYNIELEVRYASEEQPRLLEFTYSELTDSWNVLRETKVRSVPSSVAVDESIERPPVLRVTLSRATRSKALWDPNPQLREVLLGEARVFRWEARDGVTFQGGLYLPPNYEPHRRYPLVVQTHGLIPNKFIPSGLFPSGYAARELAAAGFVVLQVGDKWITATESEIPTAANGYESAASALAKEGIIDPDRVGIMGFSRTVAYVLESLTGDHERYRAALLSDGFDWGYWPYLTMLDYSQSGFAWEADAMIGARPFGEGLKTWLERAAPFKMDRVQAPVLVVAAGPLSVLLEVWEPYAALRYLEKPVDLVVLNTKEHLFTEPRIRNVAQGETVDWFRFWLQGYENPDPAKVEQYRRWERLCDLQIGNNPGQPSFCVRSKPH